MKTVFFAMMFSMAAMAAKSYQVTGPVTEMTDMVAATRAFQANVTAFEATKTMGRDALRLIS